MFDFRFVAPDLRRLDEMEAEVLACGIWRDERPFGGLAGLLDWRLAGRLSRLARQGFLLGDLGEALIVPVRPRLRFDKLLVVGLGPRTSSGQTAFRQALERMLDALGGLATRKAALELPCAGATPEEAAALLLELAPADTGEVLWLIEGPESQKRLESWIHDNRRRSMHGSR